MGEKTQETTPLSDSDRRDWLRLIRTEQIGPATFHQLLQRFGDASSAIGALPDFSRRSKRIRIPDESQVVAEMDLADRMGASYVASCEPEYPPLLRTIHDPPPVICVCGDISLFQKPAVAIVGARNASSAGRKIAKNIATDLGTEGIAVVSGLARGIDGAAHAAALATGTIAVVAGGVDVIYPPEHDDLTRQIASEGLLVSEVAPGYRPKGRDFPRRNRIISGLSLGVIVVEAAQKSGTLITARFALEQGRDVFAVPGSPLDPRSQGTNRLLRDGAILVERADDVVEHLNSFARSRPAGSTDFLEEATDLCTEDKMAFRDQVKSLLSFTPVHRDDLIRASDLPVAELNDILLDLVLDGEVDEQTGGRYALTPN